MISGSGSRPKPSPIVMGDKGHAGGPEMAWMGDVGRTTGSRRLLPTPTILKEHGSEGGTQRIDPYFNLPKGINDLGAEKQNAKVKDLEYRRKDIS